MVLPCGEQTSQAVLSILGVRSHVQAPTHAINDQDVRFIARAKTDIECLFLLLQTFLNAHITSPNTTQHNTQLNVLQRSVTSYNVVA